MSDKKKVYIPETEMITFKKKEMFKLKITEPKNFTQQKLKRSSLHALEDLVQCTLCMDRLTEPKMLICQHTFCLNCLESRSSSEASSMECPTCKAYTPLEKGLDSITNLPQNLYINSILKLLSGSLSPRTPTCQGPETCCIKCQIICEFSEQACQHCKQIFCKMCWFEHITDLKDQLNLLQKQLSESSTQLEHRLNAFTDRCLQLKENIRSATEFKINEIQTKSQVCLSKADEITDNGIQSCKNIKTRILELQTSINKKEFEQITDNKQKIIYFLTLHRDTTALLKELSRWGDARTIFDVNTFKIDYEVDASPDAEADDEVCAGICVRNPLENHDSLLMFYKTKVFAPKLTWDKCLRPTGVGVAPWDINCIYIAGSDSKHIYGIEKQKGKLLFRITSPLMICPTGLAFSPTRNEIFVSDKWKHCIHVLSKDGTYLKTFGKKGTNPSQFSSPEGVALGPNDQLFICDTGNDRIQILNAVDGSFIRAFGVTGSGNFKYTELNMPTGIAIHDNKVIVADSGNRRIKIYTLDGEKIQEFGNLGKNKGQFRSAEVVTVDPLGFIIVGDSGNARIQIFRPNGVLVRVFRNKGKFAWISGIHMTSQLEMIVTDYKSHTVSVF